MPKGADTYTIFPSAASTIRRNDNASVDFPEREVKFRQQTCNIMKAADRILCAPPEDYIKTGTESLAVSTYHPDFLPRPDSETDVVQCRWQALRVLHDKIINVNLPFS